MPADPASQSDAASTVLPCFLRGHREAKLAWVFGTRVRFLVEAPDVANQFALVELYVPAFDPGPPPHAHDDCEELFHVLEGALKVMVAGKSAVVRPGDTLVVPRGMLHTCSNPFLTPCRCLVQLTPGGFEGFFREIGVPPASPKDELTPPPAVPPTAETLRTLARKYQMRVPGVTE